MISVVVFSYSNTIQSILVNYAVTEMGCFDDYSDTAPHAKTIRWNSITNFILHVAQCIIVNQAKFVRATLIYEAWLKSLYSRLGFKVIKDFATSPNSHYELGKSKALQKQTIGLQCYLTIPRHVTILRDNIIDLN